MNLIMTEHLRTLLRIRPHLAVDREALLRFQARKLGSIVSNAFHNVRYYRDLFEGAGLRPEDIHSPADLERIPVSQSRDLRGQPPSALVSRRVDPSRLVVHRTSGSSGRPFVIRRSPMEEHLLNMFRIRAWGEHGVRWSDRIAILRIPGQRVFLLGRLRQSLRLFRRYPVSIFDSPRAILDRLESLKPQALTGYPGVLSHLAAARAAVGKGYSFRPRLIMTGGEMLTSLRRRRIESSFQAPVSDLYGAHECNLLAWQCPTSKLYHLCEDNVIVEVLKNGRPALEGESGQVVITNLHSYAMPFIRYGLGDVVTRGPDSCPCGLPFASLSDIQGRVVDYFHLPGGEEVNPLSITLPIIRAASAWLDQHRLIQEKEDRIVHLIKPLRPPSPEELAAVEGVGEKVLGPEVEFRIRLVDEIRPDPSGKYPLCQSRVDQDTLPKKG